MVPSTKPQHRPVGQGRHPLRDGLEHAHGQSIERYLLTGQYPFRHGWTNHHDSNPEREGKVWVRRSSQPLPVSCENMVTPRSLGGNGKSTTLANDPTPYGNTVSMNIVYGRGRSGRTANPRKILESLTSSKWSKGKSNLWSGLNQWVPDRFHTEKQRQAFSHLLPDASCSWPLRLNAS